MQERFYFGDNVLPCFESGIPLLKNRLLQMRDSENVRHESEARKFVALHRDFLQLHIRLALFMLQGVLMPYLMLFH